MAAHRWGQLVNLMQKLVETRNTMFDLEVSLMHIPVTCLKYYIPFDSNFLLFKYIILEVSESSKINYILYLRIITECSYLYTV